MDPPKPDLNGQARYVTWHTVRTGVKQRQCSRVGGYVKAVAAISEVPDSSWKDSTFYVSELGVT